MGIEQTIVSAGRLFRVYMLRVRLMVFQNQDLWHGFILSRLKPMSLFSTLNQLTLSRNYPFKHDVCLTVRMSICHDRLFVGLQPKPFYTVFPFVNTAFPLVNIDSRWLYLC